MSSMPRCGSRRAPFEDSYRNTPISEIVMAARLITERAPAVLDHLGVRGVDNGDLEDLAAVFAPPAVYLISLIAGTVEGVFDIGDFTPLLRHQRDRSSCQ